MEENKSEVARLMQQITLEYQAAKLGLSGLASGTATHAFITAKMERMSQHHEALSRLVGPREATILAAHAVEKGEEAGQV
ncbi:MAG: hypothetical protein JO125_07120 [Chloroflexi bacterium]|nr:hypothetical protein [Ktedonobacteraceae bacterium]MBV9707163.1 hypothetical protein [Chloroflexota bacterium]